MDFNSPIWNAMPGGSFHPGETGYATQQLQQALARGGQKSPAKAYARSFLELGEIPPGFQMFDMQGPRPLDGQAGLIAKAIAEANKSGNTALYKIGQQYFRGGLALKNALAARGILDSGETNYQLADLTKAFADAQAAARSAALAQAAGKAQTGSAQVAADWTNYITQRAQGAMSASQQPYSYAQPYQAPQVMTGGGSAEKSIQNLFNG
jgi:hypothetical protein